MPINSKRHDHHRLPYKNLFEGTYTQLHLRIILTGGIDTLVSQAGAQYARLFKQCIDFGTVIPSDQELIAKVIDPLEAEYADFRKTEEYKDIMYVNSQSYIDLQKFNKECWSNALMTAISVSRYQMLVETIFHFNDRPDAKPNLLGDITKLSGALMHEITLDTCTLLAKCAIAMYESFKTLKHNERLIHSELEDALLSCIVTTLVLPCENRRNKSFIFGGRRILAKLKEHDSDHEVLCAELSSIYYDELINLARKENVCETALEKSK